MILILGVHPVVVVLVTPIDTNTWVVNLRNVASAVVLVTASDSGIFKKVG